MWKLFNMSSNRKGHSYIIMINLKLNGTYFQRNSSKKTNHQRMKAERWLPDIIQKRIQVSERVCMRALDALRAHTRTYVSIQSSDTDERARLTTIEES